MLELRKKLIYFLPLTIRPSSKILGYHSGMPFPDYLFPFGLGEEKGGKIQRNYHRIMRKKREKQPCLVWVKRVFSAEQRARLDVLLYNQP